MDAMFKVFRFSRKSQYRVADVVRNPMFHRHFLAMIIQLKENLLHKINKIIINLTYYRKFGMCSTRTRLNKKGFSFYHQITE